MEDVEDNLINSGFTNETLQKMMNVQHQLLKLENATFIQEKEKQRTSETNQEEFNGNTNFLDEKIKQYFNTTETLNKEQLPLKQQYQKKSKNYFKTTND